MSGNAHSMSQDVFGWNGLSNWQILNYFIPYLENNWKGELTNLCKQVIALIDFYYRFETLNNGNMNSWPFDLVECPGCLISQYVQNVL